MDYNQVVFELLRKYSKFKDADVIYREIESNGISLIKIRDKLLIDNTILEENLDNNIYIAAIKTGLFGADRVVVAVCLVDDIIQMYAVSKDGVISKSRSGKSLDILEECLMG